ncbi:hypothetical protein DPEC_G00243790 [Dallia pectoralis]|uniref:Uncharacterized protein n=1 Tax=Dallia pectoralis TaxID=75939 RepID=A0ACC2FVD9_DALPE|nr:hypothetical protein DPEC_G00243790 [Dallia pectoralis]
MGERMSESAEREENRMVPLHAPVYPLPEEIQQMDRSETVCQYCGVSYLILHEFQLLQERLAQVERELQNQRGSAQREKAQRELLERGRQEWEMALREELRMVAEEKQRALKDELKTTAETRERFLREELERSAAEKEKTRRHELERRSDERERELREQLEKRSEERILKNDLLEANSHLEELREHLHHLEESLKSVGLKQDLTEGQLEKERGSRHQLRSMCARQQQVLREALSLFHYSRQELREIQGFLCQLTGAWEDCRSQLLERSTKAFTVLTGELSRACAELQRSRVEKDNAEQLLVAQSTRTEELAYQQMQVQGEQRDTLLRMSQELREKEEGWSSCQRMCKSLQTQLLTWQQREEGATRKYTGAERDVAALRAELEHARQESGILSRDREQIMEAHREALSRTEERFRQELCLKLEAGLEEQRSQTAAHLKEWEAELKRKAKLELVIDREKSREMLLQYQREKEQLQNEVLTATQELRDEVRSLRERLREVQEEAERSSAKEEGLRRALEESREQGSLELSRARTELQQQNKDNSTLQDEVVLLQETVRRECEERGELTAALTHAREQLLGLRRPASRQGLPNLQGKPISPWADPQHPESKVGHPLNRSPAPQPALRPPPLLVGGGRSSESWHGEGAAERRGGRERGGSLPKLKSSAVGEVKRRVHVVMERNGRP